MIFGPLPLLVFNASTSPYTTEMYNFRPTCCSSSQETEFAL